MSTILYSFKCPVAGCTQVITVESNDETDALSRLTPAVGEHVSTAHAGVTVPGNLEDLVRTGMYQGGSGPASADPNAAETTQPGIPAGVATPTETNAMSLPATETPAPVDATPGLDAVGSTPTDGGTYAANPSVEVPTPSMPSDSPVAESNPEPMAGDAQSEVPAEAPVEPALVVPTEENQNNQ